VVRDDVEQLADSGPAQLAGEEGEPRLASELVVDVLGVDHVVAVGTAARGLEVRRAVKV